MFWKCRKAGVIIIGLLLMFFAPAAISQLVVSDPALLSQMVQQISQGIKMAENIQKQINTAEKTARSLEGNLRRGISLQASLANYRNILEDLQRSIPTVTPQEVPSGRAPDMSKPSDVKDMLDYIYNPDDPRGNLSANMQKIHRQNTALSALESSEIAIASTDKKFAELQQLIAEIDSTQTLKDSADMSNKLLVKILSALYELNNMNAQLTRLTAAHNYKPVSKRKSFKKKKVTTGEKWSKGVTHGGKMFADAKCSRHMKAAGLCS